LIERLDAKCVGPIDLAIEAVVCDSRRAVPGALFAALRGAQADGRRFVGAAVAAGACAVLAEAPLYDAVGGATAILVPDARRALAEVAARFYGEPASRMTLIGVTGTNGKTSTVRMVESILLADGRPAGSLTTISNRFAGRETASALTTPESIDLQRTLSEMRGAGITDAVVEVSSHALASSRVHTLRFAAAVFTNLTQDHLDFHGDMDSYASAKSRLFSAGHLAGAAVLPVSDRYADTMEAEARRAGRVVLRYGRGAASGAGVYSTEERADLEGARFVLHTPEGGAPVTLPLPGDFQIQNALGAAAAALSLGIPLATIVAGLEACPPVPGRFERASEATPAVFVDYAHTPDAIDSVLRRVRALVRGRLLCVFGCGGDRDRTKRARMAEAACRHADLVIATSDNPRTEDPAAILRDVAAGLTERSIVVPDRREAIRRAIAEAQDDDVVVIAGKGHETYQQVGTERRPFDDREEARAALRLRAAGREV
jgi:UDP-N-acetylmuramoyl-L-alanyl-D-glutamate--2,6-diaminopimelate ligase